MERPLFEVAFASQTMIPRTPSPCTSTPTRFPGCWGAKWNDASGWSWSTRLASINNADWSDLFWAIHPDGRAILDHIEGLLGLNDGKLAGSRHVVSEFGNMSGTTVIFVLEELRRRRQAGNLQEGQAP